MKYTPGPLKSSEQNPFCPVLLLVFGAGGSVYPLPRPGSVHFLVFLVSLKIREGNHFTLQSAPLAGGEATMAGRRAIVAIS